MGRAGRPTVAIELTDEERETLVRWSRRHSSSQALALRSRIVLACAHGRHRDQERQPYLTVRHGQGRTPPRPEPQLRAVRPRLCDRIRSVLFTVRAVTPGIAWTVECESPVGTITGHWRGEPCRKSGSVKTSSWTRRVPDLGRRASDRE